MSSYVFPLSILEKSFRSIEAPRLPPKTCAKCGTAISCVYLILNQHDDIIYIGSTTDLLTRLYQHGIGDRGSDRRALYLPLPESVLQDYEGALIRELKPRNNKQIPRHRGHDAEILFGLGLRDTLTDSDIAA